MKVANQLRKEETDCVILVPCCVVSPHLVCHIIHGGHILLESGNAEGWSQLPLHLLPCLTFQISQTELIQIWRSKSLANDLYFNINGGGIEGMIYYLGQ